jgi:hypothetical protein
VLALYSTHDPVTLNLNVAGGNFIFDGLLFFEYEVCPPLQSPYTLTIESATITGTNCPAIISADSSATIIRTAPLNATIVPFGNELCALPGGMPGYAWSRCSGGIVLNFSSCYTPDTSGCYCVSIISPDGCRDTACYQFIIDDIEPLSDDDEISITPNPSKGVWHISLPRDMALPVRWILSDTQGKIVEKGAITSPEGSIRLVQQYAPGVYFLKLDNSGGRAKIEKVILQ